MEVKKSAKTACENFIYRREEKTEAISRSFLSIKIIIFAIWMYHVIDHLLGVRRIPA